MNKSPIASSHYQWLDMIRFLAAFCVLLCHGRGYFLPEYGALPVENRSIITFIFYSFTRLGHEAVIIFFVLSGYLVGGRGIQRIINKQFNWQNYAVDRLVRIFLPLLGAVVFVCVAAFIQGTGPDWELALMNLLSLQGIFSSPIVDPFWSLSYEVWFYIILGCVGGFALIKNISIQIILMVLLTFCVYVFTKLSTIYLFIWLIGAMGYFIPWTRLRYRHLFAILILFISALLVSQLSSNSRAFTDIPRISQTVGRLYLALTCSLLVSVIVHFPAESYLAKEINLWGSRLAVFSYTLYLTHVTTFHLMLHFGVQRATELSATSIVLYFSYIATAMIVAYILYLFFEKHTNLVKQKLKCFIKLK